MLLAGLERWYTVGVACRVVYTGPVRVHNPKAPGGMLGHAEHVYYREERGGRWGGLSESDLFLYVLAMCASATRSFYCLPGPAQHTPGDAQRSIFSRFCAGHVALLVRE